MFGISASSAFTPCHQPQPEQPTVELEIRTMSAVIAVT
jgi:hypothetical protein